jgi:hypothetical protein
MRLRETIAYELHDVLCRDGDHRNLMSESDRYQFPARCWTAADAVVALLESERGREMVKYIQPDSEATCLLCDPPAKMKYRDLNAHVRERHPHAVMIAGSETGAGRFVSAGEGVVLIAAEREAHITREGYTSEHDDAHDKGELADAAAVYARLARLGGVEKFLLLLAADWWPWTPADFKQASPIRMLVKAGALIAAEIDRRLRAGEKP